MLGRIHCEERIVLKIYKEEKKRLKWCDFYIRIKRKIMSSFEERGKVEGKGKG